MQAPAAPTVHVPMVPNAAPYQPTGILTPEEFENLKRQIRLLRISQLRYIVQKYDLPANGNKTRLVQIVLNLFDAMRNTPLLSQINQDVLGIISSFHEPFVNPLDKSHKLYLQPPESFNDIAFSLHEHPFICYPADIDENGNKTPSDPLLGPIYALPGISSGKFTFSIERALNNVKNEEEKNNSNETKDENNGNENGSAGNIEQNISSQFNSRICLDFAWPNGEIIPFDLSVIINHSQIRISNEDPYPLPIDITDFCKLPAQPNSSISPNVTIEFSTVQTQTPMIFCVRQYKLSTIASIAAKVLNVNEGTLVQKGPIKEPLTMDQPPQNWVEELAKQLYQPKQ